MKKLWAPWRMEFILGAHQDQKPAKESCVFCGVQGGKPSSKNLVLFRGKLAYIIMNKFPYSNGHLLVIPNRHLADFTELTTAEHAELGQLAALGISTLKKALKPHGFNVGLNLGEAAGAGIRYHLHYHIVPRWNGDHNFMPVLAEAKCLPEHLTVTYQKLKKAFG